MQWIGGAPMSDLAALVEKKLKGSLLRRLEGGRAIDRHPHVVWFGRYSKVHEFGLAFAAAGVSHPLLAYVTDQKGTTTIVEWLGTLSFWGALAGALVLFPWLWLRVYVKQERLAEIVPLYRSCKRELGELEARLTDALEKEDPIAAINELMVEAGAIVGRYYKAGNWPWQIGPEDSDTKIQAQVTTLVKTYGGGWQTSVRLDGRKEAA